MTPDAVKRAVPFIQRSAENQIRAALEHSIESGQAKAEDICQEFTVDLAWRQILGLDLDHDEIIEFKRVINDWMRPSARLIFKIRPDTSRPVKARFELERMIGEKIDQLERSGTDASTLSGMVFAIDEDDSTRKLTRAQAIDNSLVLIVAGSETAAVTLQNIILLMGLHPTKWDRVIQEQDRMREKHGDAIDKDVLDKECPYLEAVVKEAMRIRPVESGNVRITKNTQMIDGYQVPKGWGIVANIQLTHELDPTTFEEDYSHMDLVKGFRPERWLDPGTRPTSEFMPMGTGYRYCLGSVLAYTEMKVFLAVLARNADIALGDGMDGSDASMKRLRWKPMGFLPSLKNGVPFRAAAREHSKLK